MKETSYYDIIASLYDTVVPRDVKGICDSFENIIQTLGTGIHFYYFWRRGKITKALPLSGEGAIFCSAKHVQLCKKCMPVPRYVGSARQ